MGYADSCDIHPDHSGLARRMPVPIVDSSSGGLVQKLSIIWASALSLLVLGIFTDDPDLSLSLNDFALIADRFYRRSYFHFFLLLLKQTAIYFTTEGAKIQ